MTRAAIYLRQSLERDGSVSRAFQEADCRQYAERRGWAVAGVWTDVLSGKHPQRPQYREMLAAAGLWDVLLEALAESGAVPDSVQMVDSTIVRAHVSAAGAKGGKRARRSADPGAATRRRSTSRGTSQGDHLPSA